VLLPHHVAECIVAKANEQLTCRTS